MTIVLIAIIVLLVLTLAVVTKVLYDLSQALTKLDESNSRAWESAMFLLDKLTRNGIPLTPEDQKALEDLMD